MSLEDARLSAHPAPVRLASPLPRVHIPGRVMLGLAIVAAVTIFTVFPVGFGVGGSFNTAGTGQAWSWGFGAWYQAFTTPRTLQSIGASFVLALRAPIAVIIGFFVSWLLVRVRIPGKSFIEFALWASFFLPGLPIAERSAGQEPNTIPLRCWR